MVNRDDCPKGIFFNYHEADRLGLQIKAEKKSLVETLSWVSFLHYRLIANVCSFTKVTWMSCIYLIKPGKFFDFW